jgi:hypothetical protein
VIKCVSDLQQVDGFLWLLKYCKKKKSALNTIKPTNQPSTLWSWFFKELVIFALFAIQLDNCSIQRVYDQR